MAYKFSIISLTFYTTTTLGHKKYKANNFIIKKAYLISKHGFINRSEI